MPCVVRRAGTLGGAGVVSAWTSITNGRCPSIVGATADDIAWSFSSSTEFSSTYGSNLTDARFLEIVYQNVLGRGYDQAGFEYWLGVLRSGTPRFGAVRWIAAAPEFVTLYPYR